MRAEAAEGLRDQHAAENRDGPSGGDNHPSSVGGVGLAQGDIGIDAVAEKDEHQGAEIFAEPDGVHSVFLADRWMLARRIHGWVQSIGLICGTQALCLVGVVFAKGRREEWRT